MVMQIEMPFVSPSASTAESATHCVRMSHGETERMKIGTSTAARSNEKSSVAFGVHGGRAKAELEASFREGGAATEAEWARRMEEQLAPT